MKNDLTGIEFGFLKVLRLHEEKRGRHNQWECLCVCGKTHLVTTGNLNSGGCTSCGCNPNRLMHARKGKQKAEYTAWQNMKKRCYASVGRDYENYKGRGIKVCDSWLESYSNFYKDMGDKPSEKHSLERLDVNGNYEPSNCIWATLNDQARNTRVPRTNTSGFKGVSWYKNKNKWMVYITYNNKRKTIGYYENLEDAVKARKEAEEKYWGNKNGEIL